MHDSLKLSTQVTYIIVLLLVHCHNYMPYIASFIAYLSIFIIQSGIIIHLCCVLFSVDNNNIIMKVAIFTTKLTN